jgi:hypothetical protein
MVDGRTESGVWSRKIAGTIAPGAVSRIDHLSDFSGLFDLLPTITEAAAARLTVTA